MASSTLIFGGLATTVGAVFGAQQGKKFAKRQAVEDMKYMDGLAFDKEVEEIRNMFCEYAKEIGRQYANSFEDKNTGKIAGEQFTLNMINACFANPNRLVEVDMGANVITKICEVPMLRETCEIDNSDHYIGVQSEQSLYELLDAYYREKCNPNEKIKMDKYVMLVRYLDNMTYMIMQHIKSLQECPGEQYGKAIAALKTAYGDLIDNFLNFDSQEHDSVFYNIVRKMTAIFTFNSTLWTSKKEKLAHAFKGEYDDHFAQALAYQRNLSVLDAAKKMNEALNQQATSMYEWFLRGYVKITRPRDNQLPLDLIKRGIALRHVQYGDTFFDQTPMGNLVKLFAIKLDLLFPRQDKHNPNGKIIRFSDRFNEGLFDAEIDQAVSGAIESSKQPNVSESERDRMKKVAKILNQLNIAYALQAELCMEIERAGSIGMVASGELELRQHHIITLYNDAIVAMKSLVKENVRNFFPFTDSVRKAELPEEHKEYFKLNPRSEIKVAQGETYPVLDFIKQTDEKIKKFKAAIDKQIRSTVSDPDISKQPAFTSHAGMYTSEMALICVHNQNLRKELLNGEELLNDAAKERHTEFSEKVAALDAIKTAYEHMNTLAAAQPKFAAALKNFSFANLTNPVKLRADLEKINSIIAEQDAAENEMVNALRDTQGKLQAFVTTFEVSKATTKQHNAEVMKLTDNAKRAHEAATSAAETSSRLNGKVEDLSAQMDELKTLNDQNVERLKDISARNASLQAVNKALFVDLTTKLYASLTGHNDRFAKFRASLEQFQHANVANTQQLTEELDGIRAAMQKDYDDYLKLIEKAQKEIEAKLMEQEADLIEATSNLQKCKDIIDAANDTVRQLRDEIGRLQGQLAQAQQQLAAQAQAAQAQQAQKVVEARLKMKYMPLLSLMKETMKHGGKKFDASPKKLAMQDIIDRFKAKMQGDENMETFRAEIKVLFDEFVIIAMQTRKEGATAKKTSHTGSFFVNYLNTAESRKAKKHLGTLFAAGDNNRYTEGKADYAQIARMLADAQHAIARGAAREVMVSKGIAVDQDTKLTVVRKFT
jgi:septal ring factor EnvC (AmiA/AmiB activator)